MAQSAAVATDAPQPLGAPDAGFDDFLKSQYDPKIKQASADTQAAYGKAAGTIAAYKEAEQRLQPPAPPSTTAAAATAKQRPHPGVGLGCDGGRDLW